MTKSTTTAKTKTTRAKSKAVPVAGTPAHEHEQTAQSESLKSRARTASSKARETAHDAKARASELAEQASDKAHETQVELAERYHEGAQKVRETYENTTRRASDFAREHPVAVGAMGLVAGFALGALLPRTARENRVLGESRDGLLHKATKSGEKALKKGRAKAEAKVRDLRGSHTMSAEERLEEGLEDTFPASDPVSATRATGYSDTRG